MSDLIDSVCGIWIGWTFHAPVIQAVGIAAGGGCTADGDDAKKFCPNARIVRRSKNCWRSRPISICGDCDAESDALSDAMQCLEAGRDVVVISRSRIQCRKRWQLVGGGEKLGRILTVYHDRRFDAEFSGIAEIGGEREPGRIVRLGRTTTVPTEIETGRVARSARAGKRVLADLGPHLLIMR